MNRISLFKLSIIGLMALSAVACKENAASSKDTKDGKTPKSAGKKEIGKKKDIKLVQMKQSEMTSPWKHSKVGDWAEFNPHFIPGKTYRHEITKIENGSITFTIGEKGKPARAVTKSFEDLDKDYNPPESLKPLPKISEKEYEVEGGPVKCTVFIREGLGSKTETWRSKTFPLNGGDVKSVRDGKLELKLVAWGRK